MDQAVRQSDELTGWRATYGRVIDMIVQIWTDAAPEIKLDEPDDVNVVLAAGREPDRQGQPIDVASQRDNRLNLALYCDWAVRRFQTRDGKQGPVTGWGKKPSGARFELGVVRVDDRGRTAILTDGPWLLGAGSVRGTFRLRLPKTEGKLSFQAHCGMHGKRTKSDGVTFRVVVAGTDGKEHNLFEEHTSSHLPRPVDVDLTPFAGREIDLSLIADSGPDDDFGWDTGAWITPMVVVVQ